MPALRPDGLGLSTLARKLRLTAGHRVALLNWPAGFLDEIRPGPAEIATDLVPGQAYDAVVLFVHNTEQLRRFGSPAVRAVRPDGLLWITYPKDGATDLPPTPSWVQRDVLGEVTSETGYRPVAFVAVDDSWTAMRFKRV